jgi:hypothetical protein
MSQKTPENQASTNINNHSLLLNTDDTSKTLLSPKTGVDAWRINPQITKPTSTSTGAQGVEILES